MLFKRNTSQMTLKYEQPRPYQLTFLQVPTGRGSVIIFDLCLLYLYPFSFTAPLNCSTVKTFTQAETLQHLYMRPTWFPVIGCNVEISQMLNLVCPGNQTETRRLPSGGCKSQVTGDLTENPIFYVS